ncbi:hypothetical protein EMIHUDRAFT_219326 [Emiliania huxleyi CCMP1516]|uniref:Major facilitator superfamily (MFS) profile domain-containing protein n=2 Tax=Emiliania huxleyi TaxID=2903 RepID=A0A0D3I584_EMIH1|nr:hypothetical protein EMIHUDRAFT_219326 [Emiliania huxleyi CCMP1516]EOD06419.1 hypothetical protein EMIHUDRAFT_219326 [Emiliania huxleyi CCMP1516]|eukprot:XP_005758848.1 hypothetical protein EMIHUDRAFT_219326 [Emiliania huxleyi CCMP1516]
MTSTAKLASAQWIARCAQLIVLVDYVAVGAMRTVLPYYVKHLGASGAAVGALETLYGVGQIAGAVALGWLSDARGRKAVLLLSFAGAAAGYSVASAAVALGSVPFLLASRLPVGVAKQTVTATRAIIADITPPDARSAPLARLFAGCSLGYAVGPVLGGLLADYAGGASPLPAAACAVVFVALMPCGALVMLASTSLPLLSLRLGWSASMLGLYNSAWGVASGVTPAYCLRVQGAALPDRAALRLGIGCLALTSASLSLWSASARVLWAARRASADSSCPTPLPRAVLGRLDAAGSLCRVLLPPAAGALADGPGLWAAFAAQAALCLGGLACTEWWFRRAQAGQAQERLKAA